MIKNILFVGITLMLVACSPKPLIINPTFKSKIQSKQKLNVSMIRPDTHFLEIGLTGDEELIEINKKSSKILTVAFSKTFGEYFTIKNITNDECLAIKSKSNVSEKCSSTLTMFRKTPDANNINAYTYDKSKLSQYTNATVYIYAMEVNRSAAEMTKDVVLSSALLILGGTTMVKTYTDRIRLVITDNSTGKILWKDETVGSSLDIDDNEEMIEVFQKFKENFKKEIFLKS